VKEHALFLTCWVLGASVIAGINEREESVVNQHN